MAFLDDDDLNGDGIIEPGETAPVMQTTSAPTPTPTPTPVPQPAPGTTPPPAASNTPPWLQQFRTNQDKRIADWRGGTDAFFGGLDKMFTGDLKGGFGQWNDFGDAQRTARRTAMDERMSKLGDRFKMPEGFASKLPWGNAGGGGGPWGRGHGMNKPKPAAGSAGAPAPGAPGTDPSLGTPKESKPAQHGAWWAGGWGGGKNRQGGGSMGGGFGGNGPGRFSKPMAKKPATPAATTTPEEDDDLP